MDERGEFETAAERRHPSALDFAAIRAAGSRVARTTISEALPKPLASHRWHARRGSEASRRP